MPEEKERIVYAEFHDVEEASPPEFIGMGEREAKALQPVIRRFLESYAAKDPKVSDEKWLEDELRRELPEKPPAEIKQMSRDIVAEVAAFDRRTASIHVACDAGQSKEAWFAKEAQAASAGVAINAYGDYLERMNQAFADANDQMMEAIKTQSNVISQCPNLDGFIAEQQQVNDFNLQAALEDRSYRAEVLRPTEGETYGANSFDVAIRENGSQKILHQYQFKFGQDAPATIRLFKSGKYDNQRFVVPEEQMADVQKAFPGKSVTDAIGGTARVPTRAVGLTKAQVKESQRRIQEGNRVARVNWNRYNTKALALHLGKQAALAGIGGAALGAGIHLAARAVQGEDIRGAEVVEVALTTGADAGVKAAAVGALKVGVEKGMVPVLARSTPVGVLSGIVCMGIENAKIMARFAKGEISGIKALDCMARTSVATVCGLQWGAGGAAMGAALGSVVPVVGNVVGGIVGGVVGYVAGSGIGSTIYSGAKKLFGMATNVAKSVGSTLYHVGTSVVGAGWGIAKSVGSGVISFVSSLFD